MSACLTSVGFETSLVPYSRSASLTYVLSTASVDSAPASTRGVTSTPPETSDQQSPLDRTPTQHKRYVFGVEANPDTVAIAMVYFVQGVLGLSRLAVSFFFKDELGLDPAEVRILFAPETS